MQMIISASVMQCILQSVLLLRIRSQKTTDTEIASSQFFYSPLNVQWKLFWKRSWKVSHHIIETIFDSGGYRLLSIFFATFDTCRRGSIEAFRLQIMCLRACAESDLISSSNCVTCTRVQTKIIWLLFNEKIQQKK